MPLTDATDRSGHTVEMHVEHQAVVLYGNDRPEGSALLTAEVPFEHCPETPPAVMLCNESSTVTMATIARTTI